jgi:bacteriorhodopsin
MNNLNFSAFSSLGIQALTGLIESKAMFFQVNEEEKIVQDILLMELIVQGIEFIFYFYLVYMIITGHVDKNITSHRYLDWSITTPVMLVSFIIFFKYLRNPDRKIRFIESINEEKSNIIKIVLSNALMLLFGFLAERSIISTPLGVALGFIPFAYTFKLLYSDYAKYTNLSSTLFYISFIIWGLYGVAAVLPFVQKNIFYNVLDLFSKNAYGIFIYFFLRSKANL